MKKQKDKKKWTVIIVSGFIVFSMIFSIFAIMLDNNSSGLSYNKHSFLMTDTGFKTKISGKYVEFEYYPGDLERINISRQVINIVNNSQGIAFIFDPADNISDNLQYIDLLRYETQLQFDKAVYYGITQNSSRYALPIVTCENATSAYPFIMINTTRGIDTGFSISEINPNCIIMNAALKDMIAAKDRLVYSYYGIMTPD